VKYDHFVYILYMFCMATWIFHYLIENCVLIYHVRSDI
jgi:hypothetical protein